ncbi:MAG: discoidin domain-containing protein [Kordiimonadaceae bacterium]|jgi:hypothetical protein|nr:discoidin domain-containing protein [Kordiimonadaceae bacterium]MBT6033796.1 discoidin domain-containing protein [Kordiimonadaceae bacterium]
MNITRLINASVVAIGVVLSASALAQDIEATEPQFETNILHISWGGIAEADVNEAERHWSNWTIHLIDGKTGYGWTSEESIKFPHELHFELAGSGTINNIVLDNRFEPVIREDGTFSQEATGSSVKEFELLGSLAGKDGPYFSIAKGQANKDLRNAFALSEPVQARWLKLVIKSNWEGGGVTRLSELEINGELDERGAAAVEDVSGVYDHEYGDIILRQDGHEVYGCYGGGYGQLRGQIFGRIISLSWFSEIDQNIGSAAFSATDKKIYGFWYGQNNIMGSPWNSEKSSNLDGVDLGDCQQAIYPSNN